MKRNRVEGKLFRFFFSGGAALFLMSVFAMQAVAANTYAKLQDGQFAYYSDINCTTEVSAPETGIARCVVLFGSDAEYQALVPYTNELATAFSVVLQNDVGFSEDTDWSAFDFDINGKTLSIANNAVLTIGRVNGTGTIQAPSVVKNGNFNIGSGSVIWASDITSKSAWKASGSVFVTNDGGNTYIYRHKNKPTSKNFWLGFWEAPGDNPNKTDNPAPSIEQSVAIPAAGTYYINFRYARYSSSSIPNGENTANGSTVANAQNRKVVASIAKGSSIAATITSPAAPDTAGGVMLGEKIFGTLEEGDYTLKLTRNAPGKNPLGPIIDDVAVYAKGTLKWKIPENETFVNTGITLQGEGLQIRKTGLGKLEMSKANGGFGFGGGKTSMTVQEGVVCKANSTSATCGAQYSRIVVQNGAQFDINGCKYWDYDYTLAGSGPDGTGALTSTAVLEAKTAYTPTNITGFVRNITLSADATIYAGNNMAMMFYNNQSNTMYMAGHTVTYDGPNRNYRLFFGNMSYSGEGRIVIAQNAWVQGHNSVVAAGGCDVEVYGRYWQNSGRISPVKSLVFMKGSLFRELNKTPAAIVVYTAYAPNADTESTNGCSKYPTVQLGDASHLNTTLDISHLTDTFDDSAEGTLSFHPGSTVEIEVGDREARLYNYVYKWKTRPENVTFAASKNTLARGVMVVETEDGIKIQRYLSVIVR